MNEKIQYCDYSCRTMEFYRKAGDIYIDIIGVLWELSEKLEKDGPSWALEHLNKASYWKAIIDTTPEDENPSRWLPGNSNPLMLCILACISADNYRLIQRLLRILQHDSVYYPSFRQLIGRSLAKANNPARIEEENSYLKNKIKKLKETINIQAKTIKRLNILLNEKQNNGDKEESTVPKSVFENMLTYDYILQWMIRKHSISESASVHYMIVDMLRCIGTEEDNRKYEEALEAIAKINNPVVKNYKVDANGCYIFNGDVINPNFMSSLTREQMMDMKIILENKLKS